MCIYQRTRSLSTEHSESVRSVPVPLLSFASSFSLLRTRKGRQDEARASHLLSAISPRPSYREGLVFDCVWPRTRLYPGTPCDLLACQVCKTRLRPHKVRAGTGSGTRLFGLACGGSSAAPAVSLSDVHTSFSAPVERSLRGSGWLLWSRRNRCQLPSGVGRG
jgi:hypothetical protein